MPQQDDYTSISVEQHVKFLMLLRDIYYRKRLFKNDSIDCSSIIARVTSSCNQKVMQELAGLLQLGCDEIFSQLQLEANLFTKSRMHLDGHLSHNL